MAPLHGHPDASNAASSVYSWSSDRAILPPGPDAVTPVDDGGIVAPPAAGGERVLDGGGGGAVGGDGCV
eukprot:1786-Eustigmatos_ZCMA.PRE.1